MNSETNWDLQIDNSVLKFFKKIPRKDVESLDVAIRLLPVNPYFGDIQKIKSENEAWRRRVGAYRIFFKIKMKEKIILVSEVKRRKSDTY